MEKRINVICKKDEEKVRKSLDFVNMQLENNITEKKVNFNMGVCNLSMGICGASITSLFMNSNLKLLSVSAIAISSIPFGLAANNFIKFKKAKDEEKRLIKRRNFFEEQLPIEID